MKHAFKTNQYYHASCMKKEDVILINSYSGDGLVAIDPLFETRFLSIDSDDSLLGMTLLQALAASRTLVGNERVQFLKDDTAKLNYQKWVDELSRKFGYKTKRALFKDLINCEVTLVNQEITISPTRHCKLEAWDSLPDLKCYVSINESLEKIGKCLRQALDNSY